MLTLSPSDSSQAASSSIAEMEPGTTFQPVLSEPIAENDIGRVKRVVFLTGKMYYDLVKERAERGLEGKITFVRIEVRCYLWAPSVRHSC